MKKAIAFLMIFLLLGISQTVQAETITREPYHISGTVKDQNGNPIEGAVITIENLETGITNNKNPDGSEITTLDNGNYLYEVLDMGPYSDGDRFKITATKGDKTGSKTITVNTDDTPGYDNADITIQPPSILCAILIALILILILSVIFGIKKLGT